MVSIQQSHIQPCLLKITFIYNSFAKVNMFVRVAGVCGLVQATNRQKKFRENVIDQHYITHTNVSAVAKYKLVV